MKEELKAIIEEINQIVVWMNIKAESLERFCDDYANACASAVVSLEHRKREGPDDGREEYYNDDIKNLEKAVASSAEMYSQYVSRVRPIREYAGMLMDLSYKYSNLH